MTTEAEEVRVILKDGTVARWCGEDIKKAAIVAWEKDGIGHTIACLGPPTSQSKPLAKVTVVEGRLVDREMCDEDDRIAFPRDAGGSLRCRGIDSLLFPDGIAAKYDDKKDDYGGPQYRFRIEVFAEKVEEKTK